MDHIASHRADRGRIICGLYVGFRDRESVLVSHSAPLKLRRHSHPLSHNSQQYSANLAHRTLSEHPKAGHT